MTRILVVDDSPPLLAAVGHSLREQGFSVTSTNSGADALCLLKSKPPPDLVLLDLCMPGALDGYQVLQTLGPTTPPIIIITSNTDPQIMQATPKVARVLMKPFDQTTLLKVVRSVLDTPSSNVEMLKATSDDPIPHTITPSLEDKP